jgi:hypothetical protein
MRIFHGGYKFIDNGDEQYPDEKCSRSKPETFGVASEMERKRVLVFLAKNANRLPIPVDKPANRVSPKANIISFQVNSPIRKKFCPANVIRIFYAYYNGGGFLPIKNR